MPVPLARCLGMSSSAGLRLDRLFHKRTCLHAVADPSICLHQDDYEALLTVYPVCTVDMPLTPSCNKVYHHLGLLRVALTVGTVLLLGAILSCALHYAVGRQRHMWRTALEAKAKRLERARTRGLTGRAAPDPKLTAMLRARPGAKPSKGGLFGKGKSKRLSAPKRVMPVAQTSAASKYQASSSSDHDDEARTPQKVGSTPVVAFEEEGGADRGDADQRRPVALPPTVQVQKQLATSCSKRGASIRGAGGARAALQGLAHPQHGAGHPAPFPAWTVVE